MVTAVGTPQELMKNANSLTGAYLSGKKEILRPKFLRNKEKFIILKNANLNNLKNLRVKFPLNVFCGISGVSGSGKSTLIMQELVPELNKILKNRHNQEKFLNSKIENASEVLKEIDNLVVISQAPIGRSSRSNPSTYLGIFDEIRKLYAKLPESDIRGYKAGQFSFNVDGGRCFKCQGNGTLTISMHFLSDVVIDCDQCKGSRYSKETLEIKFKDKNIAQVLDMTIFEAYNFFQAHSVIAKKLQLLCQVGLDYLKLGQSSTTLSGGEAQRIKLASELSKRNTKTIYILDEPTTGLHSSDVEKLLVVLQRLVDKDNTVIVIEHNLDVLKSTDYLIDLGKDGGDNGGNIIAVGTPEDVANEKQSYTGKYLKKLL
jgi:excinuclease ABC subunit A